LQSIQFDKLDIHVHFPQGSTPKDGPSAGIAIVTALISMFKNKSIDSYTAMTGEFTLRGLVLPVGGIKEKILAAHRAGIKKVILPIQNDKDLRNIPLKVLQDLNVITCKDIYQVLYHVDLLEQPLSKL
jgi:ATP-dependent Lon protease